MTSFCRWLVRFLPVFPHSQWLESSGVDVAQRDVAQRGVPGREEVADRVRCPARTTAGRLVYLVRRDCVHASAELDDVLASRCAEHSVRSRHP
jgi:hypothetical protein